MKLEFAMLADAATTAYGKFFIHGGGFSRIGVPALPWTQSQFVLIARFVVDPDEPHKGEHTLAFRLLSPDGAELVRGDMEMKDQEIPGSPDGEEIFFNLTLSFGPVDLETEGLHRLELDLDGDLLKAIPIRVVVGPPAP